jgi:hypothetical protein
MPAARSSFAFAALVVNCWPLKYQRPFTWTASASASKLDPLVGHQLAAILTAAAVRSAPYWAWVSRRTREVFVFPAFSPSRASEIGLT